MNYCRKFTHTKLEAGKISAVPGPFIVSLWSDDTSTERERERERERDTHLYLSSETSWPLMSLASKSKMEVALRTKSSTSLAAGRTVSPAPWRALSQLN